MSTIHLCSAPKPKIKIEIPSPRKKESPREEATKKVGKNKKTIHKFSVERRAENVPELVGIVENVDTGVEVVAVLAAVRRRGATSQKKKQRLATILLCDRLSPETEKQLTKMTPDHRPSSES